MNKKIISKIPIQLRLKIENFSHSKIPLNNRLLIESGLVIGRIKFNRE